MKIDPIIPKNNSTGNSEKKVNSSGETKFQDHLEQAMDTQKTSTSQGSIGPIEVPSGTIPEVVSKPVVQKLEQVVSTLELYHNAYSNPDIQFAQMENLVAEMNEEKDELLTRMIDLPQDDKLRGIVKEAALLVVEETNKYYRLRI